MEGAEQMLSEEDLKAHEFVRNVELARWLNCGVKPWELRELDWDEYERYAQTREAELSVRRSAAATAAAQASGYRSR